MGPQLVSVSVYKVTSGIEHKFECDGYPCTSRTVTLDNLVFGSSFLSLKVLKMQARS